LVESAYFGGETGVSEVDSLIGPGGTLFLIGKSDVLLTTLDGGEATVPLGDFALLFRHLVAANALPAPEEVPPPARSQLLNSL
jgi:hypothetical protein